MRCLVFSKHCSENCGQTALIYFVGPKDIAREISWFLWIYFRNMQIAVMLFLWTVFFSFQPYMLNYFLVALSWAFLFFWHLSSAENYMLWPCGKCDSSTSARKIGNSWIFSTWESLCLWNDGFKIVWKWPYNPYRMMVVNSFLFILSFV